MKISLITSCIISLVFTSACGLNFKVNKLKTMLNPNGAIYYADVDRAIFKPSCVGCHNSNSASGGVILDSYPQVKIFLTRVSDEVSGGTMPPSAPLSSLEQQYLAAWIRNGAPEVAASNNGSTPTPTPGA